MILIALLVLVPLVVEARRAARNERALRARGGIEPPRDVYRAMQVAYPGAFLAMIVEGGIRGGPTARVMAAGALLFAAAKAFKWWAIRALGSRWTFRVIVVPGAPLVTWGPYRYVRHPNYIAVAMELAAVALMTGARVAGPIAVAAFGVLILRRIGVEERALGAPFGQDRRA